MFNLRKTHRDENDNVTDSGLTLSPRPNKEKSLKGENGRLEQWAELTSDGRYSFHFLDVGNYGKERWAAQGFLSREELGELIGQLQSLYDGTVTTTRVPTETAPETSAPASTAAEALPVEEARVAQANAATNPSTTPTSDDMDSLTA